MDDRRATVRYRRRLETFWQMLGVAPREMAAGRVFDLSATGVGLVVPEAFTVGAVLVVRLRTVTRGWGTHLVRVRYCRPEEGGGFALGCLFVRPLGEEELEAHLTPEP